MKYLNRFRRKATTTTTNIYLSIFISLSLSIYISLSLYIVQFKRTRHTSGFLSKKLLYKKLRGWTSEKLPYRK